MSTLVAFIFIAIFGVGGTTPNIAPPSMYEFDSSAWNNWQVIDNDLHGTTIEFENGQKASIVVTPKITGNMPMVTIIADGEILIREQIDPNRAIGWDWGTAGAPPAELRAWKFAVDYTHANDLKVILYEGRFQIEN